jgi:hypothetical protein
VNNEDQSEKIDHLLDVLSKPLNRYILSVLAGVNPGTIKGSIPSQAEIEGEDPIED